MSVGYEFEPKSEYFVIKKQLMDAQDPACLLCPEAQRETVVSAVQIYMGYAAIAIATEGLSRRVKVGCKLEKPARYSFDPEDAPACNVERSDYA